MNRRHFLSGIGLLGLGGCAQRQAAKPAVPAPLAFDRIPELMPVRAQTDRIFRVTVCLRPFRAAGPRLDVERVGDKTVVHNYGHGGSGWSLSWGSSSIATEKALEALAGGEKNVAVIGCGALGLTSATLLQQAGAKVAIYAKDRPQETRSARATGSWTPDSRIAFTNAVSPDFPALWERMCRKSFHTYETYLGMPGNPIEWTDRYALSEESPVAAPPAEQNEPPRFASYHNRVADLTPHSRVLPPGAHPFPVSHVTRNTSLMFNIADYSRQLLTDFLIEGGRLERLELHSPSELSQLPQKVIVNATGYGARDLWKDESIVPVRGQIAWLIPQPEVNYGLQYKSVYMLSRRDGIVVQDMGIGEMEGYNDANEQPDRQKAEAAVQVLTDLYSKMRR